MSNLMISFPRQGEVKDCSLIFFPFGPDPAAVAVDDALDDGKTHARALIFGRAVEPLEYAEELVIVTHVEADTVIFYIINIFTPVTPAADLDDGIFSRRCELDGVRQKV